MQPESYPVTFVVDYPDRPLNRLTTFFRLIVAIPILIVLGAVAGATWQWSSDGNDRRCRYGRNRRALFFAPFLMILFRRKYPRWWFDFNLELQRFLNRVAIISR